jgi:hypothetical protein
MTLDPGEIAHDDLAGRCPAPLASFDPGPAVLDQLAEQATPLGVVEPVGVAEDPEALAAPIKG